MAILGSFSVNLNKFYVNQIILLEPILSSNYLNFNYLRLSSKLSLKSQFSLFSILSLSPFCMYWLISDLKAFLASSDSKKDNFNYQNV
jgi:hypothetical protein